MSFQNTKMNSNFIFHDVMVHDYRPLLQDAERSGKRTCWTGLQFYLKDQPPQERISILSGDPPRTGKEGLDSKESNTI